MDYDRLLAPLDGFSETVRNFVRSGGLGLNVTVPFKQQACAIADQLSERAQRAGAVNTLTCMTGERLSGDNTDGAGLVRDLTHNQHVPLKGARILLLGAGGAARGVLGPLLEQKPVQLVLANRTASRAVELARMFSDQGLIRGCGFDDLGSTTYDLVINATSAGLDNQCPPIPHSAIGPNTFCYDMFYSEQPTAFVRLGRDRGAAHAVDGLGMLVEQAAESFHIWRGVKPDTAPVITGLRGG
jgi:shikimate dehydrogenase